MKRYSTFSRITTAFLTLVAALLISGCGTPSEKADKKLRSNPAYQPVNVHREDNLQTGLLRVVMLPVYAHGGDPSTQNMLDTSFKTQITRLNRFEIVMLSTLDMERMFGRSHLSTTDILPHNLTERLKDDMGANAILFTEITRYDPYQPLVLGVRSSLVKIDDKAIIWAFDDVFNTGDPRVTSGALAYQDNNGVQRYPLNQSGTILHNPMEFSDYVAHVVYRTIQNRGIVYGADDETSADKGGFMSKLPKVIPKTLKDIF